MIVSRSQFGKAVTEFLLEGQYGLDTETTGLTRKDRLFSLILSNERESFYFNFQEYPGLAPEWVLPRKLLMVMRPIFENPRSTFFIHNAKFDMGMLAREGIEILGSVHCTEALARVLYNAHLGHKPYSLASCAKRINLEKDGAVDEYVKKHKLYSKIKVPGKDKLVELKHFERVPWEIMSKYAMKDGDLHRQLGLHQMAEFEKIEASKPVTAPSIWPLVENERRLTAACFRMEETGIRINRPYVEGALSYTQLAARRAMQSFVALTGIPYENSPTALREAFSKFGVELPKTPTGKPCTKADVLEKLDNPLSKAILEIRGWEKLASTYYSSFLYYADSRDLIHANVRQGGTETSRVSYSNPNLQNLPKEDEPEDEQKPFLVRRCFMPVDSDWCFVPIDFKQQEFRMMLDYAGERGMIDAIMGGLDVHDATSKMVGVTRKQAKTLNFGLLYGMGAAKLAAALGVPLSEAYDIRARYFEKLPRVQQFIQQVIRTGESRGFIWNWFGFRNHLFDRNYAYTLPNHLIQGGCGQVIRRAIVELDEYIRLKALRSRLVIQVHDELLFQVHKTELHHVAEFKRIMEGIYKPKNGLVLECSVEHSWKSYAKWDQVAGAPTNGA